MRNVSGAAACRSTASASVHADPPPEQAHDRTFSRRRRRPRCDRLAAADGTSREARRRDAVGAGRRTARGRRSGAPDERTSAPAHVAVVTGRRTRANRHAASRHGRSDLSCRAASRRFDALSRDATRCRSCPPRRPSCRRGSAARARTAARGRPGTRVERCSPSNAISTTCSGRTVTTQPSSSRRQLGEPLGLPRQHLVGHALERLAEHHEPVAVARAEVDVRQRPLPPPGAPLDRQHHEVEGVARLDLDPGGPAPAGLVGRVGGLDDDALLTGARPRRRSTSRASSTSAVTSRCTTDDPATASSASRRRSSGASSRSTPSTCRASKKNGVRVVTAATSASFVAERAAVSWNGRGRPSGSTRERLTVEHELGRRHRADRRDDLRHPGGDVVEAAGEHPHVVAPAVHLDPDAVELGVDDHRPRRRGSPTRRRRPAPTARASAARAARRRA